MTDSGGTPRPDDDTPTPGQGVPGAPGGGARPVPPPDSGPRPPAPPGGQPVPPPGWEAPAPPPPQYSGGLPQYQYQAQPQWSPHGLGKPGVIPLRPLNIGDILDGAITAIRRYPLLILGMSAIVAVISTALTVLIQTLVYPDLAKLAQLGPGATEAEVRDAALGVLGQTLLATLPSLLITLLARTFLTGFLTVVMGKAVLGRPVDFRTAMSEAAPRLLPLLGLTVLFGLATGVGALLCIIPGVIVYVFWSLASPALVLERGTVGQAFSRSRTLVSGSFWRVFGILLLAALIGSVISGVISIPFGIGSGLFSGMFNPSAPPTIPGTGALVLQGVGNVIAETIVTPFVSLVTVVLYIDQRMRREGMDIELARAAGMTPPPAPQAW